MFPPWLLMPNDFDRNYGTCRNSKNVHTFYDSYLSHFPESPFSFRKSFRLSASTVSKNRFSHGPIWYLSALFKSFCFFNPSPKPQKQFRKSSICPLFFHTHWNLCEHPNTRGKRYKLICKIFGCEIVIATARLRPDLFLIFLEFWDVYIILCARWWHLNIFSILSCVLVQI